MDADRIARLRRLATTWLDRYHAHPCVGAGADALTAGTALNEALDEIERGRPPLRGPGPAGTRQDYPPKGAGLAGTKAPCDEHASLDPADDERAHGRAVRARGSVSAASPPRPDGDASRRGEGSIQEVPHAVAPVRAHRRAEGPGGATTARERALLAVNNQCLLGYEPPSAEEVLDAIEAAGLRVVDAKEHERDQRLLREPVIVPLGGR